MRNFSSIVNTALGGGSTAYSITGFDLTTFAINNAFDADVPSTFAEQHLVGGVCP